MIAARWQQQNASYSPQQDCKCPVSPGTYVLKSVATGSVIDLSGGDPSEGAEVFGWNSHGGGNQKWELEYAGHGQNMTLRNVQTNSYLWVPGQIIGQDILVKSSYQKQEFVITQADRGFYISPVQFHGYVLDLFGGCRDNAARIGIWQNHRQDNQKWYFDRVSR